MKFLVPNYSWLQIRGLPPPDPRSLCPQLNLLNPPPKKIPGYATVSEERAASSFAVDGVTSMWTSKCSNTPSRHHVLATLVSFRPSFGDEF